MAPGSNLGKKFLLGYILLVPIVILKTNFLVRKLSPKQLDSCGHSVKAISLLGQDLDPFAACTICWWNTSNNRIIPVLKGVHCLTFTHGQTENEQQYLDLRGVWEY